MVWWLERLRQLKALAAAIRDFKHSMTEGHRFEFIFGGDRNFITSPEHRVSSSATGGWHPGRETIQAWSVVMDAMGLGAVVEQCDFTWQRIARSRTGENSFCRKILGGSLNRLYSELACSCTVVHTLPFPNASDHKPVALAFTDILTQRPKREAGAAPTPYVPEWLFQERAFVEELESGFEAWKGGRARGLAGIEQFNDLVAATAKEFLATQKILAKTVQQKFDIATALLGTMQCNRGRVSVKRLCKWLSSYPTLKEILAVEWSDDEE